MISDRTTSNGADLHRIAENVLSRMPAGGWLRDTSARENWRTTTIVLRHRDQADSPHRT